MFSLHIICLMKHPKLCIGRNKNFGKIRKSQSQKSGWVIRQNNKHQKKTLLKNLNFI